MKSLTKWSMTAGCCMLLGGFSGCDRLFDEEEQPKGNYTVSGRLYTGISDVPYANAKLILEGYQQQGFSGEYVDLGSAVTDESGFFSITYDRVFKDSKIGDGSEVELRFDEAIGGHLKTLPWHTDVNREFAENEHSRILIQGNFESTPSDTLFISAWDIIDGDFVQIENLAGTGPQNYIVIPPEDIASGTVDIYLRTRGGGDYKNTPNNWGFKFGIGREDLIKSLFANYEDSIPDDYQVVTGSTRGFPFTDTIKLEL